METRKSPTKLATCGVGGTQGVRCGDVCVANALWGCAVGMRGCIRSPSPVVASSVSMACHARTHETDPLGRRPNTLVPRSSEGFHAQSGPTWQWAPRPECLRLVPNTIITNVFDRSIGNATAWTLAIHYASILQEAPGRCASCAREVRVSRPSHQWVQGHGLAIVRVQQLLERHVARVEQCSGGRQPQRALVEGQCPVAGGGQADDRRTLWRPVGEALSGASGTQGAPLAQGGGAFERRRSTAAAPKTRSVRNRGVPGGSIPRRTVAPLRGRASNKPKCAE